MGGVPLAGSRASEWWWERDGREGGARGEGKGGKQQRRGRGGKEGSVERGEQREQQVDEEEGDE